MSTLIELPTELIFDIISYLPFQSIVKLGLVHKLFNYIFYTEQFWSYKSKLQFNIPTQEFNQTTLTPSKRYLQLLADKELQCIKGSEKVVNINICLKLASYENNFSLVNYFLAKGATDFYTALLWNIPVGGRLIPHLITIMINNNLLTSKVLGGVLAVAAEYGAKSIIKYLLEVGEVFNFPTVDDVNEALSNGILANQITMVDYLINIGANDLSRFLYNAAIIGNKELIDYLINKSQELMITLEVQYILNGIVYGGHKELINYAISLGSNDLNNALDQAVCGNQSEMIDYLYLLGASDFNNALYLAATYDNRILVDKLISMGASNLKQAVYGACEGGHISMIEYLLSLTSMIIYLYECILYAECQNQLEVIHYLLANEQNFKLKYPHVVIFNTYQHNHLITKYNS